MRKLPTSKCARRHRRRYASLGVCGLLTLGAASSSFADATYVGSAGSTNWNDPLNWTPEGVPTDPDNIFIADTTAQNTLTLNDGPHAVNSLTFGDSGGRTLRFAISGTNALTVNAGGFSNTQTTSTGIILDINTPVIVQGDQTWTVGGAPGSTDTDTGVNFSASSSSFTLNGKLTKEGPGQLLFIGRNIGNGDIDVNAGTVKFNAGSSAALTVGGTGTITVNAGALAISNNSGTLNVSKAIVMKAATTLQVGGNKANATATIASPINFESGTVTLNHNPAAAGVIVNFTGNWTGSATIDYTQTDTQAVRGIVLSGDNSGFTGNLTNRSTLFINSTNPLGTVGRIRLENNSIIASFDSTARTIPNPIDFAGSGTMNIGTATTGDLTFSATTTSGTITGFGIGNAAKTMNVANAKTTISGTLTGGPSANAFTKAGPGLLALTGANTYDRPMSITAGTVQVSGGGRLGIPGNSRTITVGDDALLDLQVAAISDAAFLDITSTDATPEVNLATGVNDTLAGLTINTIPLQPGTYGSSTSGAQNVDLFNPDEIFSGTGILTVVPEPAGLAVPAVATAALLRRRRRRR